MASCTLYGHCLPVKTKSTATALTITAFCWRWFQPSKKAKRLMGNKKIKQSAILGDEVFRITHFTARLHNRPWHWTDPMRNFTRPTICICFDTVWLTLKSASKKFHLPPGTQTQISRKRSERPTKPNNWELFALVGKSPGIYPVHHS